MSAVLAEVVLLRKTLPEAHFEVADRAATAVRQAAFEHSEEPN